MKHESKKNNDPGQRFVIAFCLLAFSYFLIRFFV